MKIEVLYHDIADLYGDIGNIDYLKESDSNIEVIYTPINEVPYFVGHEVNMVYMGAMKERFVPLVLEKLRPYVNRLKEMIENDVVFLITGNAFELFGNKIDQQQGLGIFDYYCITDMSYHHNSCFLGKYDGMDMVGFKSQFSNCYNNKYPFMEVIKGHGFGDDANSEGVHYHNFFGTYLIGPICVTNPSFAQQILRMIGSEKQPAFWDDALEAHNNRVEEFYRKNIGESIYFDNESTFKKLIKKILKK